MSENLAGTTSASKNADEEGEVRLWRVNLNVDIPAKTAEDAEAIAQDAYQDQGASLAVSTGQARATISPEEDEWKEWKAKRRPGR